MSDWLTVQQDAAHRESEGIEVFSNMNAFTRHRIVRRFALYSGGNDSMCSTHFAMKNGLADEVIHLDTGVGIKKTHAHAEQVMKSFGWPYRILTPPDWTYRDMVLRRGFPGPAAHRYAYSWLKERAIAKLVRETKKKWSDRVVLITGVRNRESSRRMGYVHPIIRMGARIWVAPFFSASKADCQQYRTYYSLPVNPVSEELGYSGECLCGAFAKYGEIKIIERIEPETAITLYKLQDEAKAAGKHCIWGTRPPRERKRYLKDKLFTLKFDDPAFMPMCVGCLSDHAERPVERLPKKVERNGR